jgi:hypothetical protein
MRKELATNTLPAMFSHYEALLSESSSGFFVGASPTGETQNGNPVCHTRATFRYAM